MESLLVEKNPTMRKPGTKIKAGTWDEVVELMEGTRGLD